MKKRGFTLIELMVVIAIIGLLAAIALPRFANVSDSAKVANVQGNLSTIRTSIAMFHAKTDVYPDFNEGSGHKDALSGLTGGVSGAVAGNKSAVKFTEFYGKEKLAGTPADSSKSPVVAESNTVHVGTANGNSITATTKSGWAYIKTTGDIRASLADDAYNDNISWDQF